MTFSTVKKQLHKQQTKRSRASLRAERKEVDRRIRELRKNRKGAKAKVRAACQRSWERVKARAAELRAAAAAEVARLKGTSRGACAKDLERADSFGRKEEHALYHRRHETLNRERLLDSTTRVIEGKEKRLRAATRKEARLESNDEVRRNIDPELHGVWAAMQDAFKKAPKGKTRTEAFLEWAEANPEEVMDLQFAQAEADVADDPTRYFGQPPNDEEEPPESEPPPESVKPEKRLKSPSKRGVKKSMKKTSVDPLSDVRALHAAVGSGGFREPELAAMLQWPEERVWKASKSALKSGLLEREPLSGELRDAALKRSPLVTKDDILEAFDKLNAAGGGRYYVALVDLRAAVPGASRARFDELVNELRRDWVLTLSPAEGRHETVPKRILDAGIVEQGRNLVYVSRRE
jgi:hypothetical protein